MKKTTLLALALASTSFGLHAAEQKADGATKANALIFIEGYKVNNTPIAPNDKTGRKKATLAEIGNGNFYYYNTKDTTAVTPKIIDADGIKGIELVQTTDTPQSQYDASSALLRLTKIPANAPKAIAVKFKTKVTKVPFDGSWADQAAKWNPPNMQIRFVREDGKEGGGTDVKLDDSGKWVDHEETISIPSGAAYLKIYLQNHAGYTTALGNWKIE
jgi:hypothetical protein